MYETYPKGKKSVPNVGHKGVKSREQDDLGMHTRNSITGGEEKRMQNVYGNYYGKKPAPERPMRKGAMVSPRKTFISIG